MERDLGLVGLQFNWALSIFYIVYLLVEVPSNIILKRVGPRLYLPGLVIGFGLVSLCTSFVTSYPGLMVARVFLGAFEGGAMPGSKSLSLIPHQRGFFMGQCRRTISPSIHYSTNAKHSQLVAFYLSTFYKRKELLFRIGIYVSAASMAGAFGGLLATGLSRIPEWGTAAMPIHTWRNIFFFEGLVTMLIGFIAPFFLPSSPAQCKFLSPREQYIAAERLLREHRATPDEKVTWESVKRAVFCVHNYTCAFGFFLINITVQGLSVFLPTILRDLNWTDTKAQLYSVPPYVCACLVAVLIAYISDKTRRRGLYLGAFSLLAITGFAILRWEDEPNVRYMGVFFVTVGAFPGGPGFLAWAINSKLFLYSVSEETRE